MTEEGKDTAFCSLFAFFSHVSALANVCACVGTCNSHTQTHITHMLTHRGTSGSLEKSVGGRERWDRTAASGGLNPCDDQVHSDFPSKPHHIPVNGRAAEGYHGNKRPEILTLTSNRPVKQPN